MLSKTDFFNVYGQGMPIAHAAINGKKHSLSKELYFLRKLILDESNVKDGNKLYNIAIYIYQARHKKLSSCQKIIAVFFNFLCGRGLTTTEILYDDIILTSKIKRFQTYQFTPSIRKSQKRKFAPKKLF